MPRKIVVGLTGASGVGYGIRMISRLCELKDDAKIDEVFVIYTENAVKTAYTELGLSLENYLKTNYGDCITIYKNNEWSSPLASSSRMLHTDVVIIPCTLNTLAKISSGIQDNLLTRVALNALRLRNRLVLVVRETPLSLIDLFNMLKVTLAGAVVLPASPGFYNKPENLKDLEDFIVGKVLDVLGIENKLYKRWLSEN